MREAEAVPPLRSPQSRVAAKAVGDGMRDLLFTFTVVPLLVMALAASAFAAPQKSAVFPFELNDMEQEQELFKKVRPEETRRLQLITEELARLLTADGRYEVVDLGQQAADIEKFSPFYKCDGCENDIAKKAGAELAVTGVVDKLNDALLSVKVFVRDVASGAVRQSMSAEVRGNTDENWIRGVRYLARNKLQLKDVPR